jgi:TfoX/Sxy family transcriptional regulator of competence genes
VNADIEALRRDLTDAATHLGRPHDLRFKPMFGGLMAYFDEKPLAWLSSQGMALKVPERDQAALLAHEGTVRFRHRADAPPSRGYLIVPASLCRDTPQLAAWLERCAQAAPAAKKRPRPKARPR